jgi:class 3 adenylate cyclase/predicted ATPase
MLVCASCGTENPDRAKFCLECAAPLAGAAPPREARKVVSVVFCDVVGSTALGESGDPELVRGLLARYFQRMKAIAESHGGTVEKFIGDAVVAVFGVPVVHEDDALRAVRTAFAMQQGLRELELDARIGVNSGEVVTGTAEWLATGDAVNVAARLQQAAEPGEVLLGAATLALVGGAVDVERLAPVAAKGKGEPVEAYRLAAVRDLERPLGGAFVGREREHRLLREAFELAVSSRACHLFTLLGAAGVGKSRLVAEVLAGLDATVVRGRCLSYGDGITYWPVVEVVKPLRPEERELSPAVGRPLAVLLGGDGDATADEIAFAVRKLLEETARERPLIVVWDDLHWGEATFLDLVEHVADWSRDAPILLLCLARPELLDERQGWGGGKLHATTVLLDPLEPALCEELMDTLAPDLEPAVRSRVLEVADGNPLFVEETVAMARASATQISVPPTIGALLAARLDQLPGAERQTLETGAVEGVVFHRSAVNALGADSGRLLPLVRKELLRPEQSLLPDDEAFRFRHALIREAAYSALPKRMRATLHERFADWLEDQAAGLVELDEMVGYHLEQAHALQHELGENGARTESLGERAGVRLAAAGRRAIDREDKPGGVKLLSRACELLPKATALRRQSMIDLANAFLEGGEFAPARELLEDACEEAERYEDAATLARSRVALLGLEGQEASRSQEQLLAELRVQIELLEGAGDRGALAEAWELAAMLQTWLGSTAAAAEAYDAAVRYARETGRWRLLRHIRAVRNVQEAWGHRNAASGIEDCNELLSEVDGTIGEAYALAARALYRSWRAEHEDARADIHRARLLLVEFGDELLAAASSMIAAQVELMAGDPSAAAAVAQEGYDRLASMNEKGFRSTVGCYLAESRYRQGLVDEAESLAREAGAMASSDDFVSQASAKSIQAKVLAARGHAGDAERLAREAVEITGRTDSFGEHALALCALAEVLERLGRADECEQPLREAIALFERKGAVAGIELAQRQLAAARAQVE